MSKLFSSIRSAAIDGRCYNILYRKTQLKSLFDALISNASTIEDAIAQDVGNRTAEIKIELCLAMDAIRKDYESLDPAKSLEEEYKIAKGIDFPTNRVPIGVVVIQPSTHTFVYSILCAISASIAAGNCIIFQLENTTRKTPEIISQILKKALDNDIFAISTSKVNEADIGFRSLYILQEGKEDQNHDHQLVSLPQSRTVAIVERDADLEAAAKAIVSARFSLSGKSPYAPDLVLVNEWVKEKFLEAVIKEVMWFMARDSEASGGGRVAQDVGASFQSQVKSGEARAVMSGSNGVVLDVLKRKSSLLSTKIPSCCLIVHSTTSMDDAIDLANSSDSLLAAYIFTQPTSAKYLAQFVDSAICFINEIPTQLLFGPAFPQGQACDPSGPRYLQDCLSISKPHLIQTLPASDDLSTYLFSSSSKSLVEFEEKMRKALRPMNRPDKAARIGFFDQGILIGASLFLVSVLSGTGVFGYYAWRAGGKFWRR